MSAGRDANRVARLAHAHTIIYILGEKEKALIEQTHFRYDLSRNEQCAPVNAVNRQMIELPTVFATLPENRETGACEPETVDPKRRAVVVAVDFRADKRFRLVRLGVLDQNTQHIGIERHI